MDSSISVRQFSSSTYFTTKQAPKYSHNQPQAPQTNTNQNIVLTILTAITILIVVIWNVIQYRQMKKQLEIQNEQIRLNFFQDYTNKASQLSFSNHAS